MDTIADAFESAHIGQPVRFSNLTMVPLLREQQGDRAYITLDEALEAGTARVTEVSDGGSVSELRFLNDGDMPVLLLDGEELIGAKQDRILNLTILAPAQKDTVIPVSCVEAGRWRYRSSKFRSSKHTLSARMRAAKAEQVHMSMSRTGTHDSDQRAIWRDLGAKASRLRAHSPTGAMSDMYEQHETPIDNLVENLPASQNQVGAVFVIDNSIAGIDIFDRPETFAKLLPKLVRGYALDAVDPATATEAPTEEADKFLAIVASAKAEVFPAVGLGEDFRLSSSEVAGGALVVDQNVIHLGAFPKPRMEGDDHGNRVRA